MEISVFYIIMVFLLAGGAAALGLTYLVRHRVAKTNLVKSIPPEVDFVGRLEASTTPEALRFASLVGKRQPSGS